MLCFEVVDGLWVGDSRGVSNDVADLAVLNVANDLPPYAAGAYIDGTWSEYAHVGLVDGPGNTLAAYCAAVLTLAKLRGQHDHVFVCCHSGSRSMVVTTMYLTLTGGRRRPDVNSWSHWPSWTEQFYEVVKKCGGAELPNIHDAHIVAYRNIPWGLLEVLL
jgi:hypothetical protein